MPSSEVEHISKEDNETEKEKNVDLNKDDRLKFTRGFLQISHQPFSVKETLKIRSKN